jgi:hypothetical protein
MYRLHNSLEELGEGAEMYHPEELPLRMSSVVAFDIMTGDHNPVLVSVSAENGQGLVLQVYALQTQELMLLWSASVVSAQAWDSSGTTGQTEVSVIAHAGSQTVLVMISRVVGEEECIELYRLAPPPAAAGNGTGQLVWSQELCSDDHDEAWISRVNRAPFSPHAPPSPPRRGLSWQSLRSSFMQQLPHRWLSQRDSRTALASFERHRRHSKPHPLHVKQQQEANGVALHWAQGVSALSLTRGELVASLRLPRGQDEAFYADLNRDGMLEAVHFRSCRLEVFTGLPARSKLFDAPLCSLPMGNASSAPFALPLALPSERRLVVATAEGAVLAWSARGQLQWKLSSAPGWSTLSPGPFVPSLSAFHALPATAAAAAAAAPGHVLVVGASRLALLSAWDGQQQASVELPHPPSREPLLCDFNRDGLTDVVLVTSKEILGLRAWRRNSDASIASALLVGLCIALLVLVLHVRCAGEGEEQSRGRAGGARWIQMLSLPRSTDEAHLA